MCAKHCKLRMSASCRTVALSLTPRSGQAKNKVWAIRHTQKVGWMGTAPTALCLLLGGPSSRGALPAELSRLPLSRHLATAISMPQSRGLASSAVRLLVQSMMHPTIPRCIYGERHAQNVSTAYMDAIAWGWGGKEARRNQPRCLRPKTRTPTCPVATGSSRCDSGNAKCGGWNSGATIASAHAHVNADVTFRGLLTSRDAWCEEKKIRHCRNLRSHSKVA